jgi:hypothetical protein
LHTALINGQVEGNIIIVNSGILIVHGSWVIGDSSLLMAHGS